MVHPPHIADYALLSDGQTSALVSRDGSVDWYCPPRFDAPTVFARLLDADGGSWSITPTSPFQTTRRYVDDTLTVETTFTTDRGKVTLTDALALGAGEQAHEIGLHVPSVLLRQVRGVEGAVELQLTLSARPQYAQVAPLIHPGQRGITIQSGSLELILQGDRDFTVERGDITATFTVKAGETVDFALLYRLCRAGMPEVEWVDVGASLENTRAGWQSWADEHQNYRGLYADQVRRSALVLEALTFQPTGAVIAAATTSLPEEIGGDRNWDYRYTWLRDLTLTMRALWVATCSDEVERLLGWMQRALGDLSMPKQTVQIVYGVEGERDLPERTLEHLRGYQDSRPVRIGNDAWGQKQLDTLGEVVESIYLFREHFDRLDGLKPLVIALADRAAMSWNEPDSGMWEARDKERPYLTSKVMCWVALDRAVKLAPDLGEDAHVAEWEAQRDAVREAILTQGWNEQRQAFTGAFGSDELDASVLIMPLVEFLPATDPHMAATIRTIERELSQNGQVFRWKAEKNSFIICTFWLVECLALLGEVDRAMQLFERTVAYGNDLGLFAEMIDLERGEMVGNFPQAFSHVGLINAAQQLSRVTGQLKSAPK